MGCKYRKRVNFGSGYTRCKLDNSIRKDGCPCNKYSPNLLERIKSFFKNLIK